jgi:hypothetical protein
MIAMIVFQKTVPAATKAGTVRHRANLPCIFHLLVVNPPAYRNNLFLASNKRSLFFVSSTFVLRVISQRPFFRWPLTSDHDLTQIES